MKFKKILIVALFSISFVTVSNIKSLISDVAHGVGNLTRDAVDTTADVADHVTHPVINDGIYDRPVDHPVRSPADYRKPIHTPYYR